LGKTRGSTRYEHGLARGLPEEINPEEINKGNREDQKVPG
jgi:hypothetical protein